MKTTPKDIAVAAVAATVAAVATVASAAVSGVIQNATESQPPNPEFSAVEIQQKR